MYNDYSNNHSDKKLAPAFSNLGAILQNSIMSSVNTILMIGGFVILFSVVISILNNSKMFELLDLFVNPIISKLNLPIEFANGIFAGIIELTNGVSIISSISVKAISVNIVFCAFLLGFGGISVVLQVFSIVSESGISIKPYILGKLLQGVFAALYTYLIIHNFQIFNLDLI